MAINFPDSPSNGDTQTINGSVYTYNSTTGKWDIDGDNTTNVSVSDTAPSGAAAGDQWFNSTDGSLYVYYNDGSSSQWVGISGPAGSDGPAGSNGEDGGVTSYANKTAIDAVSSPSEGDLAYDLAADQLYIRTTTAWKRVSVGVDESPIITTEPASTHDLNIDGSTSTVTMVAEDPEGFDVTYGIAYPTASNALPDQLATATSINQSTGVYTFNPSQTTSHAGSVKVRLSASDGVSTTTRFCTLSLAFQSWTQLFSNNNITFANGTTRSTSSTGVLAFSSGSTNFSGGSQSYRYWRFDITDLRGGSSQSDTQMLSLHLRNGSSILSWGLGNTSTTPNQVSECIMHRTDTGAVLNVSQYNRGNSNGTYEHAIVKGLSTASSGTKFYFGLGGIGNGDAPNYTFIIDAQSQVTATGFNYYVGDDVPDRDPKGFTVYGSNINPNFS
tara:strand:- start:126 stop:1451 length:1326 start_codon:yes stop_codon:yes gene_type:complete